MAKGPYWKIPKIWPGATVYIVGGGPSLKGVDLTPIKDRSVIGVNSAYLDFPWIPWTFFGDKEWYRWHSTIAEYKGRFFEYEGIVISNCENCEKFDTRRVKIVHRKRNGICQKRDTLAWNRNGGGAAINLAYHLGAKKIILLGYDMKQEIDQDGKVQNNYHNHHKRKDKIKSKRYTDFIHDFQYIARDAEKLGLEIINANIESALPHFPKVSLNEVGL